MVCGADYELHSNTEDLRHFGSLQIRVAPQGPHSEPDKFRA